MEREDGMPVTSHEIGIIKTHLRNAFNQWGQDKSQRLPKTYGAASSSQRAVLEEIMYTNWGFLELCNGDWKVHRLASQIYTQWHMAFLIDNPELAQAGKCM